MPKSIETVERYRGCLLGLAAGDALGATLEFRPPGTFKAIKGMTGGGAFRLKRGQWTDDTSMALCLAESLIESKTFDPTDQLNRYLRWCHEGYLSSTGECFGIGGTVSAALMRFERTREPYCGSTDPRTAGNGSIMRLAPVPLFFARRPLEAVEKSADSSGTTHGAQTAVDGCRYLGSLIVGALSGAKKEDLLGDHYCPVPAGYWHSKPLTREIAIIASGSFKRKDPPEIKGTGYVVESLQAALWAFNKSTSFEEGCLLAVNLGDDADTTGAVYGQLAGAFYGVEAIPGAWREKIARKEFILSIADRLFAESERIGED